MATPPGRVWGPQHPFERTHLQRARTLFALGTVFAAVVVLLARTHPTQALGSTLVGLGVMLALAAASRRRYLREARGGFPVLATRDGRLVLGSALSYLVAAGLVLVLMLG